MARSPYRDALLAARQAEGSIEVRLARELQRLLDEYAENLEELVRRLDPSEYRRSQSAALRAVNRASTRLDRALADAVREGREVNHAEVLDVWRQAMRQVAASRGVSSAVLGRVRGSPGTMLGHFARLQAGNHWRTLIRGHVVNAAEEANRILVLGAQEGIGPEEMARRLRRYVQGSEDFQELFTDVPTLSGDVAKIDLSRVPREVRNAAGQMVHNSRRIAFSELHNARAEAEVQHFLDDPFVATVTWTLSPVRSTVGWVPPDECDYLAATDAYGLGPGVYPVDRVPAPPHPWDRCEKIPNTRATRRIAEPKPQGTRPSGPGGLEFRFSTSSTDHQRLRRRLTEKGEERARSQAWAAIRFGMTGRAA